MKKKLKITVFGGSGFLGSHVAEKLSDDGHQVVIFDLKQSPYLISGQEMLIGDIRNQEQVEEAVKGADIVYNFAGYSDLDTASTNPYRTAELNLLGSLIILDSCLKYSVKQFVYASTIYVYSESGGFYRCSKQAAETFIDEYNRKFGLTYTILRYGSLYGPRADSRNSVFRYILQALSEGRININANGDEIREYIHVRDAAKISARIIEEKYYNKRFVITGHQAVPVQLMLDMIQEILGKPVEIIFDKSPDSDHYRLTPYSFVPRIGEKFAPDIFTDMGQGLIECIADIVEKNSVKF